MASIRLPNDMHLLRQQIELRVHNIALYRNLDAYLNPCIREANPFFECCRTTGWDLRRQWKLSSKRL
jgi:hypothetical protein